YLGDLAIDPEEAAKLAADAGVRAYTIGLGRGVRHPFGGIIEPDFSTLQFIASKTGGQFYRAKSSEDLEKVYAEIDGLEKRELEDPRYRTADWFAIPLLLAGCLFAAGLLLEFLWIREVP
ncbi:MAG: hypothetical protein KDB80_10155, partial [Planctomycetes bacterium]|nr:hypothetical protein [Planctomycetota bacterium]